MSVLKVSKRVLLVDGHAYCAKHTVEQGYTSAWELAMEHGGSRFVNVEFTNTVPCDMCERIRTENDTPEQAWRDAHMVAGIFAGQDVDGQLHYESSREQTLCRHLIYRRLGAAKIKIDDEVKERVRDMIAYAIDYMRGMI